MKLCEVYGSPIKEVVEAMNLVDVKIHSNDEGDVAAIELKYVCTEAEKKAAPAHPWA